MKRMLLGVTFFLALFLLTGLSVQADSHVRTLYAGQDIPVGTVSVENDDDYLYVTYEIDDAYYEDGEGWAIYETHVHVGVSLADFPLNRGGNPQIGHFTYKAYHDGVRTYTEVIALGEWGEGDEILIAAHAVIMKEVVLIEGPHFATGVVAYDQGLNHDGTMITAARSNPYAALVQEYPNNVPDERNDIGFFSLGFKFDDDGNFMSEGGWIEVSFDYPIVNVEGEYDLRIWEVAFGTYPSEQEKVEAWYGGEWVTLGIADNAEQGPQGSHQALTVSDFDLG